MELNKRYLSRMKELLGDEYDEFLYSYDKPLIRAFHVNTEISQDKKSVTDILSAGELSFTDNGFILKEEKIGATPLHHAGALYVQEPSAMCPVYSLGDITGAMVLDMCASPGGKSSQAANLTGSSGFLISNEIVPSRCKVLAGNLERMGRKNTAVFNTSPDRISKYYGAVFDVVICDVPCSGEGMMRKSEAARSEWNEENIKMCAERSYGILNEAAKCVKPGGYLLFSTCTFSVEENELSVIKFLDDHCDFTLTSPTKEICSVTRPGISKLHTKYDLSLTRRFYPHISQGEGQYMAVLKRDEDSRESAEHTTKRRELSKLSLPSKKDKQAAIDFMKENLTSVPEFDIYMLGENLILLNDRILLRGEGMFSCGVKLGRMQNGRLIPHHQFFKAFGSLFMRKIECSPTAPEAEAYIRGNTISSSCENGWGIISVCGYVLGGVKTVDGTAKNHYPKGLREQNL